MRLGKTKGRVPACPLPSSPFLQTEFISGSRQRDCDSPEFVGALRDDRPQTGRARMERAGHRCVITRQIPARSPGGCMGPFSRLGRNRSLSRSMEQSCLTCGQRAARRLHGKLFPAERVVGRHLRRELSVGVSLERSIYFARSLP
jgi:hypothetical protein